MNILQYINPSSDIAYDSLFVSRHLTFFQNDTDIPASCHAAILGVPDNENSQSFEVAYLIRRNLYILTTLSNNLNSIDLGDIKTGLNFNDTCYAISEVVAEMNRSKILIILIGGTSTYNTGCYLAFEKTNTLANIASIDSTLSIDKIPSVILNKITEDKVSASFFNFINIAYQSYFVEKSVLDFIEDSNFEAYRLGYVRSKLNEIEPVLRDSNFVTFSLNAIKHSDAPGANFSSPNGLTGEEACQLSFFAGHSTRINTFGMFDLLPENDLHNSTAKLAAQIIWYFLEGLSNSINEDPDITPQNFTKYLIHFNHTDQNIAFYKSNLTNRWWMEIVFPEANHNILLSCSETDYELTCKQELPERWWRTFRRISHTSQSNY